MIILLRKISNTDTTLEDLTKLIDEIFKNIKSNLNADYKSLISKILIEIPLTHYEVSEKICKGLSPYIGKEGNEAALTLMLNAFLFIILVWANLLKTWIKLYQLVFADKKPALKNAGLPHF